jgi:ribosomal protein S18 acetylase RimI-like enzyme
VDHDDSGGGISVEEVTSTSDEVIDALARLVPQLSQSSGPPTPGDLTEMAASPAIVLLLARTPEGVIVGSLTLVVFRIPTGMRAWIEDVVVDSQVRGKGVGSLLVRAAVARAEAMGARTVDLTSRPSRTEANRLYVSLGFEPRETNVYRFKSDTAG